MELNIFDIFNEIDTKEEVEEKVDAIEEEKVEKEKETEIELEKIEEEPDNEEDSEEVLEEQEDDIEETSEDTEEIEEIGEDEEAESKSEEDEESEEEEESEEDELDMAEFISKNYLKGDNVTQENIELLVMDDIRAILTKFGIEFLVSNRKVELIKILLSSLDMEYVEDISEDDSEIESKNSTVRSNKRTNIKVEDNIVVDMPLTDINYSDAVALLRPNFIDEEWNIYKREIDERLGNIHIDDDMNPGTLKLVISELSELRQEIWFNYQNTKTLYETLGSKEPEGLIERVKKIAYNEADRNDMERRRTGIRACLEYVAPGTNTPVNLFEVLDETRERYNFLKSVMESIRYKTNALITMNGALKLEQNHIE